MPGVALPPPSPPTASAVGFWPGVPLGPEASLPPPAGEVGRGSREGGGATRLPLVGGGGGGTVPIQTEAGVPLKAEELREVGKRVAFWGGGGGGEAGVPGDVGLRGGGAGGAVVLSVVVVSVVVLSVVVVSVVVVSVVATALDVRGPELRGGA